MIPLAQYLSDHHGEEFTPLRPVNDRRAMPSFAREATVEAPAAETQAFRTLRPVPPRAAGPAASVLHPAPEARVPLREVEAERNAWATERAEINERHAQALEAARSESHAAGAASVRAEAEAQARERIETIRADLAAKHATALTAERQRWVEQESDRLADLMILQMAVLEDTMKLTVRNILRPLAMEARQRQALDELADAVRVIVADNANLKIAATGPKDLLARLGEKLGDQAGKLVARPDETRVDLKVEADGTVVETRLSSWGEALEKALS